MPETKATIGGGSGSVYAPPPVDAERTQRAAGAAQVQDDADLTISRQPGHLAAAQASGLITSDDLEPPRTLGDLSLAVAVLFADLTQTQAKNNTDMLDDSAKQIQENNHKRMQELAKMAKLIERQKHKKAGILAGEICGIIGGALVAGLSLGTLGPLGAAMMVSSVALATATQVTQMAGGFDAIAKSDPKLAQGLMYTGLALSVLLAIGTGGASLASSFGTAAEAAATTGEAAAETGMAMTEATTSAEAAETLMEGVSEMSTTAEAAGTDASTAGGNVAETGVVDNSAAEAGSPAAPRGNPAEGADEPADAAAQAKPQAGAEEDVEGAGATTEEEAESTLHKAAKAGRRAGEVLEFAGNVEENETHIEVGILQQKQHQAHAGVMRLDADDQMQRAIMKEILEAADDILDALNNSFKFMGTHETTLTKTRHASIAAIGNADAKA